MSKFGDLNFQNVWNLYRSYRQCLLKTCVFSATRVDSIEIAMRFLKNAMCFENCDAFFGETRELVAVFYYNEVGFDRNCDAFSEKCVAFFEKCDAFFGVETETFLPEI